MTRRTDKFLAEKPPLPAATRPFALQMRTKARRAGRRSAWREAMASFRVVRWPVRKYMEVVGGFFVALQPKRRD